MTFLYRRGACPHKFVVNANFLTEEGDGDGVFLYLCSGSLADGPVDGFYLLFFPKHCVILIRLSARYRSC